MKITKFLEFSKKITIKTIVFSNSATEHVRATGSYEDKYHMFYGNADDWNAEEQCVSGGGSTDPQCCGTPEVFF